MGKPYKKVQIDFTITPLKTDVFSGTSQGHFTFNLDDKTLSTRDFSNNQSMMLLPSITQLMDDLCAFVNDQVLKIQFVGVGSSATIELVKTKENKARVILFGIEEFEISKIELLELFRKGINDFLNPRMEFLSDSDPFKYDLIEALNDFNKLI